MTWAYSPSYGKPLSVPQGIIAFHPLWHGCVLAHPEGYNVMSEVEEVALENAQKSGGSYKRVNSMAEAFKDATSCIPKLGTVRRDGGTHTDGQRRQIR